MRFLHTLNCHCTFYNHRFDVILKIDKKESYFKNSPAEHTLQACAIFFGDVINENIWQKLFAFIIQLFISLSSIRY